MSLIKIEKKSITKKGIIDELYTAFFKNPQLFSVWCSGVFFIGIIVFGMELWNMYNPAVYEFIETFHDPNATEEDVLFAYWWFFTLNLVMFVYTTYHTLQLRKKIQVWNKRDEEEKA